MSQRTDDILKKIDFLNNSDEGKKVLAHLKTLDELNLIYFSALYDQKTNPTQSEKLRIDDGSPRQKGELAAYPTAIAPKNLLEHLPFVHYEDLESQASHYKKLAQSCALWIKKTQAGGGTSILRTQYLARRLSIAEKDVKIGAKGTDLFVPISSQSAPQKQADLSLAELQILQSLHDTAEHKYGGIFLHDIVSSESQKSIQDLWKNPSWPDPSKNYMSLIQSTSGCDYFGETFQSLFPTFNESGELTTERLAPGGHAFFAVEALMNAWEPSKNPRAHGKPLIAVIGNGEDLGSSPNPTMVGWMLDRKVAIAMITTEKTEVDLKGGQIALVSGENDEIFVALIEQAQAKEAGQLALFEGLGLDIKNPGQSSFFNTNVALFNYEVLGPKIEMLVKKIGVEEFLKIITPTLIGNKKTQKDAQGVNHVFEQLEGAMGSSLLNLDRYWRKHFKEPLVQFINVERAHRTRFFSPVKNPFDYFMLFHSDRFELQIPSMRLKNLNPGHLPSIQLGDSLDGNFYGEVQNVLDCFEGTEILNLQNLKINGRVGVRGLTLKGNVEIKSEYPSLFNLTPHIVKNSPVVENKKITISKSGEVKVAEK